MPSSPAIIALNERQRPLAQRLADALNAQLVLEDQPVAAIARLFQAGRALIIIASVGIVVRSIADHLAGKAVDPPVVAVSEDGQFAIPVIGGHHGANRLAETVAAAISSTPVISTASDRAFGIALDEPPAGYRLAAHVDHHNVATALLNSATLKANTELPEFLAESDLVFSETGTIELAVSDQRRSEPLTYHPQTLTLGIGCERGVDAADLIAFVRSEMARQPWAIEAIAAVCSLDLKEDEPAIQALAADLGVPARFFSAAELDAYRAELTTPSKQVFRDVGVYGVSEAAALAGGGSLIVPKIKGARMTMALARSAQPVDVGTLGRPRGELIVLGLGPGDQHWRTHGVDRALQEFDLAVGYGLYLDIAGIAANDPRRRAFPLGQEIDRCRFALEEAAKGQRVRLICSGDPGIYAMAALVLELLEQEPAFQRIAWRIEPGISALQLLSARAGAMIGHDFCAISLSDLLTPSEVIDARVRAAAEGDFVIAFYNPVSKTRTQAFARAKAILLAHRPADCPVFLGRNLGRPDEHVRLLTLADVQVSDIDMLTTVMVGSSQSRTFTNKNGQGFGFTPRGYAKKAAFSPATTQPVDA